MGGGQERRRLGGWWRLWVVISAIILAAGLLIGVQTTGRYELVDRGEARANLDKIDDGCIPGTVSIQEEAEANDLEGAAFPSPPEGFILEGSPVGWQVRLGCTLWSDLGWSVLTAAFLSALIAAVGLAVRWIYNGFRTDPA